ncbi:hypothetical protein Dsin_020080 [Dipteronia sinensis]|uniref:Uncharacterized protein n=1 Tax=Dipteronia sinensis TaxID=43782 RepID=A0AAE0A969_9ROSI|nr:hypothetical protein Dsin_020080 [Dipteronia sinensis]
MTYLISSSPHLHFPIQISAYNESRESKMEMTVQGLLGKVGRQCYAVFCLGVILVTVAVAYYVNDLDLETTDSLEPTKTQSERQSRRRHRPRPRRSVPEPAASFS